MCDIYNLCQHRVMAATSVYYITYVYPSHSTWDTSIAQLPTVCRCRAWQLGCTLHHHQPRICLTYHFIAVHRSALHFHCHLLNHMINGYWHICHFGCRVAQTPAPAPSGKCTRFTQCEAGLVHSKYVGVDWTARTPYVNDTEALQPIVRQTCCVTDWRYC